MARLLVVAIENAENDVAKGRLWILHVRPRVRAIGRDDYALMLAVTMRIEGEDGRTFLLSLLIERLANDHSLPGHAGMADGGNDDAVDAREDHGWTSVTASVSR